CVVDDYITDRAHKLVTTPAYMFGDAAPNKVFKGITGLINEVVEMA
ncbi:MAG: isoprenoid biosynthesis protein ElbB, partial [Bdellovibrionales bacterium]|nr:isoprenoid biosynthesis protein ElbB [Bdellovibrionales bacterium]